MIIVLSQIAGLGIRSGIVRTVTWIGTNVAAFGLAFGSVALAAVPYVALLLFAVWRLTRPI